MPVGQTPYDLLASGKRKRKHGESPDAWVADDDRGSEAGVGHVELGKAPYDGKRKVDGTKRFAGKFAADPDQASGRVADRLGR